MKKYISTLVLALPALGFAAGISEPATTFYGKVLGTADIQPFLITEGTLDWTIRRADGVDVALRVTLSAYNSNTYSYRLDVPHSALSLGLAAGAGGVPLALSEQTHRHLAVMLDNEPVELLGPAGEVFTTAQLLRSATYRLDLGVNRTALDTDGDGLPDWWEDLHGLDKQANDANQAGSGGLTAAQAYALGLDPNADHTIPAFTSPETVVYAGGDTALMLSAFDLDTAAANLTYTVVSLPFGTTALLSTEGELNSLEVGSTFTQADVLAARLVYRHDDADISDPGLLVLTLSDGAHTPVAAEVRLLLYEPAINEVSLRSDLYQFASAGFIIAEADTVAATDAPVSYALAGVTLTGGAVDDVLLDTQEETAEVRTWTGGTGADRFVVTEFGEGTIAITDFSVAEGDMLDIMAFTPGVGTLSDHIWFEGEVLVFDTGLRVTMQGIDTTDLYTLVAAGAILTDLPLKTRVAIAATIPTAYRNGPVAGEFTFTRDGDVSQAVTVNILLTGSAQNGVDYEYISDNTVVIPAGAASLAVAVTPKTSGSESVDVDMFIRAGSGYIVGPVTGAKVTIEPRKVEVGVELFGDPVMSKEGAEFGSFLVWRDSDKGQLNMQAILGGDAVRGVDFQIFDGDTGGAMNSSATFRLSAGEEEKLIEVAILSAADLSGGAKTVSLAPAAAPTRYHISPAAASAEIVLIERFDTFADWLARNTSQMQPLSLDGGNGVGADMETLLKRYAFGSDVYGSDVSGFPHPFMLSGGMTVRVKQRFGLLDVSYGIRGFTDLRDPVGSAVPVRLVPAPEGQPAGAEWQYYYLDTDSPRGFISVDLQ